MSVEGYCENQSIYFVMFLKMHYQIKHYALCIVLYFEKYLKRENLWEAGMKECKILNAV